MANSPYGMHFQPLDANGNPYPLATMHSYAAGTLVDQTTYSDYALSNPAANPIVADANGVFPVRYLSNATAYKFIISKADATVLWTDDNVYGGQSEYVGQVNASSASATPAVTGTNTSSGPAIKAVSTGGTGHAIWAEADTSSPIKSAVHIVPQDNPPSSPVKGNLYISSVNGLISAYGASSVWDKYLAQTYAIAASETIGAAASGQFSTANTYANMLRVGSIIRIRGSFVVVSVTGALDLTCYVGLFDLPAPCAGDAKGFIATAQAGDCMVVEAVYTVVSVGVAGTLALSGLGIATDLSAGTTTIRSQNESEATMPTLDTTAAHDYFALFSCSANTASVRLTGFTVDIT